MGRIPELAPPAADDDHAFHSSTAVAGAWGSAGMPVKRNPNPGAAGRVPPDDGAGLGRSDHRASRFLHRRGGGGRRGCPPFGSQRWVTICYGAVIAVVVVLWLVMGWRMRSSLYGLRLQGGLEKGVQTGGGRLGYGDHLRFVPGRVLRRYMGEKSVDRLRAEHRVGVREPRLAFVLGRMKKDPFSLLLLTLVKRLKGLGYDITIYTAEDGESYSLWQQIGYQPSILGSEGAAGVDWSIFEGIICCSLEAKVAVSSLMQEPFVYVPMIWIVSEDTLGKRLHLYVEMSWDALVEDWRSAFYRADVVVFPDISLPMMYSMLDTGNFFVISDSLADVWAAENFLMSHSTYQVREEYGYGEHDLIIVVIGSSLFYDEFPWSHTIALETIGPLLMNAERTEGYQGGSFKFVFLGGNTSHDYRNSYKEIASRLGLPDGSVRHYGLEGDVNSLLLMADIVLYNSIKGEQRFPSLLIRAMSYEIPILAPDLAIIKRYVVDGVHGLLFKANNPDSLSQSFSLMISGMKLSKFASIIASSGKLLVRNMMTSECLADYVKLIENTVQFPSEATLPESFPQHQQQSWEWPLFQQETADTYREAPPNKPSLVYSLESQFEKKDNVSNSLESEINSIIHDSITQMDWDNLREVEIVEEYERHELDELEERTERSLGSWDEIYRNARKAEKIKVESNERDEGELERTGQPLCIYETYIGRGTWSFLHHGSLYRGLSMSSRGRRSTSDDVDAVTRLELLNDTYFRDLLCEVGGMFSIANRLDNIHKIPWIGFQTWHAGGKKVSLSEKAERKLEEFVKADTLGDVMYFWIRADTNIRVRGGNSNLDFWSLCDIVNSGRCRELFEKAFRRMYNLPSDVEALPPMPDDGDYWSTMHSWVMPTPSFLEFIMFSRMFTDALDAVNYNLSKGTGCLLGSSKIEKRFCYCRMLELLVNVWAYHSARRIVYINPISGIIEEQHAIEQREGRMWVKYFNFTLLKSMDEDMAEEADDKDHQSERWLWPLTGEVYWQGVYEREREERYRMKMDKKRKSKEKLLERHKYGYRQKTLGSG